MTMKSLIKLLIGVIILFIYNACDDPTNPFDPDTPKEIWTPSDLKVTQSGNQVNLTWIQKETNIDGFEIERKVGSGEFTIVTTLGKTSTSWTDNDLTGGETYQYQLYAYAGENKSNKVSAGITPIIKALANISQASNMQPTSVTLNGSVNANGSTTTVTFLFKKKSSSDWISVDANIKTVEGKTVVSVYANILNLSPGEEYNFKIKAVNSSGEVLSAEQSFKTPDFDVSPPSREVSWQAGTTTFSINSGVEWYVTKDASWITVVKTNNTTLTANYTENTQGSPRTGNITVTGTGGIEKRVTIVQAAKPTLAVNPEKREVTYQTGTTNFTVNSNIDWNVTKDASWLTVTKTNNTTISITYTENTGTNSRTASIKVAGGGLEKTVTVIQGVKAPTELVISPVSREVTPVAGTTTFSVTSNVDWSVKSVSASWINATKFNNTTINVSYTANSTTSSRSATITVTGGGIDKVVTVIHAGVILTVTPPSVEVGPGAGTTSLTVNSNIDWSVEDDASWLTATKASSTGISVSYQANAATNSRTATITVSGGGMTITVKVIQAAPIVKGIFVDDRDKNTYKWVKIGNQIWMAENLKYLPAVSRPINGSDTDPHYYVYDYDGINVADAKKHQNYAPYGVLYNFPAAKAACPKGWHLPTFEEWEQLNEFIGKDGYLNIEGNALKTKTGWEGNGNGTDAYGFGALPGGTRMASSDKVPFSSIGSQGLWWSATETSATRARDLILNYNRTDFDWHYDANQRGLSVRCVKD